jgi:hypothetical protein
MPLDVAGRPRLPCGQVISAFITLIAFLTAMNHLYSSLVLPEGMTHSSWSTNRSK